MSNIVIPTYFSARLLNAYRSCADVVRTNANTEELDVAGATRYVNLVEKWPDKNVGDPLRYFVGRYDPGFPAGVALFPDGKFGAFAPGKEVTVKKIATSSITTLSEMGVLEIVPYDPQRRLKETATIYDPYGISRRKVEESINQQADALNVRFNNNPLRNLKVVLIDQSDIEKERIRKDLLVELIKLLCLLNVEVILIGISLDEVFEGSNFHWKIFFDEYANVYEGEHLEDYNKGPEEGENQEETDKEEEAFIARARTLMSKIEEGIAEERDPHLYVTPQEIITALIHPSALYLRGTILRYAFPSFLEDGRDIYFFNEEGLVLADFSQSRPSINALNRLNIPYYSKDGDYNPLARRILKAQKETPIVDLLRALGLDKENLNCYSLIAFSLQHYDALVARGGKYSDPAMANARVGGLMLQRLCGMGLLPYEWLIS